MAEDSTGLSESSEIVSKGYGSMFPPPSESDLAPPPVDADGAVSESLQTADQEDSDAPAPDAKEDTQVDSADPSSEADATKPDATADEIAALKAQLAQLAPLAKYRESLTHLIGQIPQGATDDTLLADFKRQDEQIAQANIDNYVASEMDKYRAQIEAAGDFISEDVLKLHENTLRETAKGRQLVADAEARNDQAKQQTALNEQYTQGDSRFNLLVDAFKDEPDFVPSGIQAMIKDAIKGAPLAQQESITNFLSSLIRQVGSSAKIAAAQQKQGIDGIAAPMNPGRGATTIGSGAPVNRTVDQIRNENRSIPKSVFDARN